jgi:hypothetical protein
LGVEPGVSGKVTDLGIAGTDSDDPGDSAGLGEPEEGAGVDSDPEVFPLPRDEEEPSSLESDVGVSGPHPDAVRRLVMTTSSMAMRIQTDAVITVTLVNVSPALVPNALDPPTPPNAPAKPPPLPRWIRIKQIRKRETRMISVLNIAVKTATSGVL